MRRGAVPVARPPTLPVIAATAGVLGIVAQLALPARTPLPEVGPSRVRAVARRVAVIEPVVVDPRIGARTLFSPSRRPDAPVLVTGGNKGVATDPFEGAVLIGIARSRTFAVAVVRQASGTVTSLRPGAKLGNWRLIAVGPTTAGFSLGGAVRTLRVGETAKVQPVATQETPEVPQS